MPGLELGSIAVSGCPHTRSTRGPTRTSRGAAGPPASDALHGDYDAFSPLGLVQGSTAAMPGAHVVLVPYLGHDVFGTYDCLREARNTWLLHPESEPDFDICLLTIPAPRYTAG